ncbi:hypothetical protein [Streptomyces sp. NPDC007346]|uniref:hypothetical protein n=1 Tax=Streptomyces sp. NPDC007346 TaxID=3154682 RepID=UPI0034530BF4
MNVRGRRGLSLMAGLVVLLAGCAGGAEREYAVPKTVCGVPVEESAVSPLLPPGPDLIEHKDSLSKERGHCSITVNHDGVISVTFSRVDRDYDPMDESQSYKFRNRQRVTELPFPGRGAIGDDTIMITAKCGGGGPAYLIIDVLVRKGIEADAAPKRAEFRKFAEEYTAGAKKIIGCAV